MGHPLLIGEHAVDTGHPLLIGEHAVESVAKKGSMVFVNQKIEVTMAGRTQPWVVEERSRVQLKQLTLVSDEIHQGGETDHHIICVVEDVGLVQVCWILVHSDCYMFDESGEHGHEVAVDREG
ncbi:hypothetical protein DFH07DRAFT_784215 [Mycena maculata]|uniref:Uncharacterized protein n=1 Tax=Mycena maculata TaxID=230809 RepID=A0AAD7HHS8_9AGAR|nr:hypothetical protein DFH07DRAFT_784215 [Mycena maculata]